jgi:hypothetical protein
LQGLEGQLTTAQLDSFGSEPDGLKRETSTSHAPHFVTNWTAYLRDTELADHGLPDLLTSPFHVNESLFKQEVLGRTNRLLSSGTTQTAYQTTHPPVLLLLCVFVAVVTFLPSQCLATIGDAHTDTETNGRVYELCR